MKFAPEKTTEIQIPFPLVRVRAGLAEAAAEKRQKDAAAPALPFFGKVTETGFKLSPNSDKRGCYTPVMNGELTEVTESKPSQGENGAVTRTFTRLTGTTGLRKPAKAFGIFWAALCAVILGLAFWLCFSNGFEKNWWTLLLGPALFILERLVCNISFRVNAAKFESSIKKMFK